MFDFVKKLMLSREINFDKGKILLLNEPICLMPMKTIVDIIDLTKNDQKNILYSAGKISGQDWFVKIKTRFYAKKMPIKDVIEWGNNIIAMAGYGVSILEKFDEQNKEIVFRLENSTVCELIGRTAKPLDHLYRGYVAGAGTVMFNEECEALEIKCKATGSPYCEFLVKPAGMFDNKNPLFKEQVGQQKKM